MYNKNPYSTIHKYENFLVYKNISHNVRLVVIIYKSDKSNILYTNNQ